MNYFKTQQHRNAPATIEVVGISDQSQTDLAWKSRWDWKTLEAAQEVADAASVFSGELYIAIDSGANTFPRFDVIRAPAVGDAVSYSFNGDTYPCGHIKSISPSLKRVVTTTNKVFHRRRNGGSWVMNKTWSLVKGHISELNPEF